MVNKDPAVLQLHTSSPATGDISYEYAGDQTWCAAHAVAYLPCVRQMVPSLLAANLQQPVS